MFDNVDDKILDLMLTDPSLEGLYGNNINREEIRLILSEPVADNELGVTKGLPAQIDTSERISIEIEPDQMVAWVILGVPMNGDPSITEDEVKIKLASLHVVHGINQSMISRLVKNPIYQKAFVIARGEEPKHGINSEVKFYFDIKRELRPVEKENGEVNFHEISFTHSVKKDDLLCEILIGKAGIDGKNVIGEIVKAKGGEQRRLPAGRNTTPSEDQMRLCATCDGEVSYAGGQVHVDRVLYVDNVDLSTGNIRHIGSVHVRGRICEGFSLKATENITVGDVIENAEVSAGGCIRVHKGIKGKGNRSITAGTCVYAPFMEHAVVSAGEDIFSSAILNSTIISQGKILVRGEKGQILGGSCRAHEVEATRIGNDANVPTIIEIMGIEDMQVKLDDLQAESGLQERTVARLQKHMQDADNPNKVETQKELLNAIYKKNDTVRKMRALEEQITQLKDRYDFDVKVRDTIYPNVVLRIEGKILRNMESTIGCIFFRIGNHVVARSYSG